MHKRLWVLLVVLLCGAAVALLFTAIAARAGSDKSVVRAFSARHNGGVLKVAIIPGTAQAISSGVDDTARIWNIAGGTEIKHFSGAKFRFQDIAFSADGQYALTPMRREAPQYWNTATGENVITLPNATMTSTVALSKDLAAGAGRDGAIHLWDLKTGQQRKQFPVDAPIVRISFQPGTVKLFSVDGNGQVCGWTADQAATAGCVKTQATPVSQAAFSSDCSRVLLGDAYGSLTLWDVSRGSLVMKLEGTNTEIVAIAISPSGKLALSGGSDHAVTLWNLESGKRIAHTAASGTYVSSVAFTEDEARAIYGTDDGTVAVWNLN